MHFTHRPKDWRRRLLLLAAVVGLTFLYIYPGGDALMSKRTDTVMSDDTDPSTLPYFYDGLVETWHKHKSWFFYGAVYNEGRTPDKAWVFWAPWYERFAVPLFSYIFPVEQLTTAFIFSLFILNFMAMYALCRVLAWPRFLSIALSTSWAFCAYTRARAKVHGALTGTYHVPLLFLGLLVLARGKTWRSALVTALIFLLSVTTAHYYIVTSAFLSPFLLAFYFLQNESRADLKRAIARLIVASAPAVGFLGYNLLVQVPAQSILNPQTVAPKGGETHDGSIHPFLYQFAAHPIDYFTGDVGIGPKDLNPLKEELNLDVYKNIGNGNPHERTNGIRWSLLLIAGLALTWFIQKRYATEGTERNLVWFFVIFGAFTFWLSLSPDSPLPNMGPSLLLYKVMNQVRVTSRAGIWVHFSILILAGMFLNEMYQRLNPVKQKGKAKTPQVESPPKVIRWLLMPAALPALVILEFPPLLQDMPMAPVRPRLQALQKGPGQCGAGLYFPYVGPTWQLVEHYHFLQRLRGSDCIFLNSALQDDRREWFMRRFPLHPEVMELIQKNDPRILNNLESAVRCIPMTWIYFDERVPQSWRETACRRLGWTLNNEGLCLAPDLAQPMSKMPEQCP